MGLFVGLLLSNNTIGGPTTLIGLLQNWVDWRNPTIVSVLVVTELGISRLIAFSEMTTIETMQHYSWNPYNVVQLVGSLVVKLKTLCLFISLRNKIMSTELSRTRLSICGMRKRSPGSLAKMWWQNQKLAKKSVWTPKFQKLKRYM